MSDAPDVEKLQRHISVMMKKCQTGIPYRKSAYGELHDLLADCYSVFGLSDNAITHLSQQLQEAQVKMSALEMAGDHLQHERNALREQLRWRVLDEETPDAPGWYSVVINNGADIVGAVTEKEWTGDTFIDVMGFPPVTHWKPRPVPPLQESSDE